MIVFCNHYPKVKGGNIHLSNDTQKSIAESIRISKKMKDDFVSIEHLILGILKSSDQTSQLLKDNGFNTKEVIAIIKSLRNGQHVTSANQRRNVQRAKKVRHQFKRKSRKWKIRPCYWKG